MLRCSSDAPAHAATAQGSASPCTLCALEPALTQLLPHLCHLLHTHTHPSWGQPWLPIVWPHMQDPCRSLWGSTGRSHPSDGQGRAWGWRCLTEHQTQVPTSGCGASVLKGRGTEIGESGSSCFAEWEEVLSNIFVGLREA